MYCIVPKVEGIVGEDLMELICHIVDTFAVCVTCRIRSIESPILHSFCLQNFE